MFRRDNWVKGSNNIAPANRLPDGFVRKLVNLDATPGGTLECRPGYEKVAAFDGVRGGGRAGKSAVLVAGTDVVAWRNGAHEVIGEISEPGPVACAEFNDLLYLSTPVAGYRCDGEQVAAWSIQAPGFTVEALDGGNLSGIFKVAVTAVEGGAESGVDPMVISLSGQRLRITSDDPRHLRIYVSVANGESLYFQGRLVDSAVLSAVEDSAERLTTGGLLPMPPVDLLAGHHAVLVGAQDRYVFVTVPMMPHLVDPIAGFFQFSAPVVLLAATEGGVFVATETRTYFLSGLESAPSQREVLDLGAVSGSAVHLPDGSAAWFTRYGQAIGRADGSVQLLTRPHYAPDVAADGASGLVDHNGSQIVVTTMRGATESNHLAAGDFAELETA